MAWNSLIGAILPEARCRRKPAWGGFRRCRNFDQIRQYLADAREIGRILP
ncbi:hypothetical protein [Gemmobacter caeruleus]|nr:hypothetical protein [Gemmobacter caeruleus]